ncbi:MAG: Aspartokinase [Chloroflexi bacterium ADurb.Bin180]|nr:MAG: Aspartokinase [Chloroflexi bacterium ADurb.Bin180]HNR96840.1 ACT domain-containing protein [Anaerolineae bacterium]
MAGKIKAGGIIRNERLAKIGIMAAPDRPGLAFEVLQALAAVPINTQFIVQCADLHQNSHIVLCVSEDEAPAALAALEPIRATVKPEDIVHQEGAAVISVFGPDFRERPSIAASVFGAMARAQINIMAISTSISTVSCLIDGQRVDDAVVALREYFDLP